MTNAVVGHMAAAIQSASVEALPAPYIFVENVFPADLYEQIGAGFESSRPVFREQVHKGDPKIFFGSYADRLEARVPADTDALPADDAQLWSTLKADLESPQIIGAIFAKFEAAFLARFGGDADADHVRAATIPKLMLTTHRPGYYLGPHTDRFEKVVTCVFNCAEREGLDHLGTTMYAPKQDGFTCMGTVHHDPSLFRAIGLAPYRPNSALIFFRDDRLFHGVERLTEESLMGSARPNIQFNLWAR